MVITDLAPLPLWRHFDTICRFPRPSRHESALREHILSWALGRGLAAQLDSGGNLIIRKPASPGMEDRQGVVLQGHLDMVAQKNAGHTHDFMTDPIRTRIENGWVHAEGTTLGADNGIGVAAALAMLESNLPHGPLEVLLTIDEESGMTGARSLEAGLLQGKLLLNLDTEEWGEVYVGCAGGVDVSLGRKLSTEPLAAGFDVFEIGLTGLVGGHSGVDIHLERGNAIRLLARVMNAASREIEAKLVSFHGGTLRNALAREAFAKISVAACDVPRLAEIVDSYQALFRDELADTDPNLTLSLKPSTTDIVPIAAHARLALDLLLALPHGVRRWSKSLPGVVETSNNLGVVSVDNGRFEAVLMVRSLKNIRMRELADAITATGRLAGCVVEEEGEYPGWTPDLNSTALALLQNTYQQRYGKQPAVQVIHAGLECGLLGAAYPNMDMVSFGPTIRGAHSPDERVEIASVASFWELLVDALAAVPKA
ncbi:aminoacyl-histidine dipeptidase [Iodobacter sp.]|uniref:aminoacyl-histidine dipeptidase n=1 Tax=Iodobacter sp. TaxID=1915058 RepID=UPI0025ED69C1|nr:aminoacyl-histidine dipeptidase [Iodobacter sp.]